MRGHYSPSVGRVAGSMMEDYTVHVIPFYKLDAGWNSFWSSRTRRIET
jgi:diadenosine tetraphosphate (Ap4A) HIT family hydrolase